jgi:uncharacterized membrane protein (UPF0182 family)
MPQLRKVALAVGSTLIYQDTYEQALEALQSIQKGRPVTPSTPAASAVSSTAPPAPVPEVGLNGPDVRIKQIRDHMQRYRELSAQGRWSEAGKELEAIESTIK